MVKYIPDIGSHRWVIISPARNSRPSEEIKTVSEKPVSYPKCPFCPGNESMTPPEVYRIGRGEKDTDGWSVRVIPNKFPITDIHEVIIHSPDCDKDIEDLKLYDVTNIFTAYRDRYRAHESDGQVLIFCNHGFSAGASLKHPHSQLVVVPNQINLDAVSIEPFQNIVEEGKHYLTYCPDFSQWPFEVWIAPKKPGSKFSDVADGELPDLASILQRMIRRVSILLRRPDLPFKQANEPFVYNYYIYHGVNWFLRIIPRAIHRAGFELGTGLNVNVIDPTDAAEFLKGVKVE